MNENKQEETTQTNELTPARAAYVEDMMKARNGDREALARFLDWLDTDTKETELLQQVLFAVAVDAETSLLQMTVGKDDLLFQEMQKRKMQQQRKELGAETGTPLERLLIDRIVMCGVQVQYYEAKLADGHATLSLRQHEFHHRRLDMVNRRYLAAIKALAQVRRLQIPAVQVNIGEKQINLVQGNATNTLLPSSKALLSGE